MRLNYVTLRTLQRLNFHFCSPVRTRASAHNFYADIIILSLLEPQITEKLVGYITLFIQPIWIMLSSDHR